MEVQHYLWHLVAQKLSGEATDPELAELELLIHQDDELGYILQVLECVWEQLPEENNEIINEQFYKLTQRRRSEDRGRKL